MKHFLISVGVSILIFLPVVTFGQDTGLVPCTGLDCNFCSLIKLGNNLLEFMVLFAVIFAGVVFAYGGLIVVMSVGNPGKISNGKSKMTDAVIGIVIVLAAWLLVDTVLKLLLNDQTLGTWNEISCPAPTTQSPSGATGQTGTSPVPPTTGGALCPPGNVACSPSALASVGFTEEESRVMSCIAMTESAGVPTARSNSSTACGVFQIIEGTWESAATGACSSFSQCTNANCNAQVARTLVQRSGYRDWTCPNCNAKAQGCINAYSNT